MNQTEPKWLTEPEDHDYPAAQDYLELVAPPGLAEEIVSALREAEATRKKAKDILRASGLPVLPESDPHVSKAAHKVRKGEPLSPVLLVRGSSLVVADGYHRICALYHLEPDTEVHCKLV